MVPLVNPDDLADLEEQRSFLKRSLDDLERELAAGEHTFTWDATTTRGVGPLRPTGIYECMIRMNGRVEKLPMVLMH